MIHKVEVGHPVTITVANAEEVEGQFGPQVKFTADNDDCLFAGKDTALRQLGRIGFDLAKVRGATLLFEKVAKNGKTYLNINPAPRANGNGSGAKVPVAGGAGKSVAGGATQASGASSRPLVPLYEECLSAAKSAVQKHLGKTATTADVMAGAATLFIQATKSQSPLFPVPVPAAVPDDIEQWPGDDESEIPF